MNTKVVIKSQTLSPFGGIFYVLDAFSRLGLSSVIDRFLGLRSKTIGYQYSEIISSLFCIYYYGGDCIEDIGSHLGDHLELRPDTRIPSPDTLLRGINELAEDNIIFRFKQGLAYSFNKAERLGALLLELLLHTNWSKGSFMTLISIISSSLQRNMTRYILTRRKEVISPA